MYINLRCSILDFDIMQTFSLCVPPLGLMSLQVPHVDFSGQDYSNSHGAVGSTPPAPVQTGEPWYNWYGALNPDEREVARVKKVYKNYLKQQL